MTNETRANIKTCADIATVVLAAWAVAYFFGVTKKKP